MLPSKNRFPLRLSRRDLESNSKTFSSPNFTFLIAPSKLSHPRFAVIVSKKNSSQAVVRNKLKRQILAVIQEYLPQIKPGFDCLILPKKTSLKLNYPQLNSEIKNFFTDAHLL